jgi:hypothetical protein
MDTQTICARCFNEQKGDSDEGGCEKDEFAGCLSLQGPLSDSVSGLEKKVVRASSSPVEAVMVPQG